MKYGNIPSDLLPGDGVVVFKKNFDRFVSLSRPGVKPNKMWDILWEDFDNEFIEDGDRELALRIIRWFNDYAKEWLERNG